LLWIHFIDIAEDRLDSLLKSINKDTPLTNNNINDSNSVDTINKTDGTYGGVYRWYIIHKLIFIYLFC